MKGRRFGEGGLTTRNTTNSPAPTREAGKKRQAREDCGMFRHSECWGEKRKGKTWSLVCRGSRSPSQSDLVGIVSPSKEST